MLYLFIGQDSLSKDLQLKRIRKETLAKETEQFNLDILHAKELNLRQLQEKLIYLPVKSQKRIIIIKDAQSLKEDLKNFLIKFLKNINNETVLILDLERVIKGDEFVSHIYKHAKVFRFKEDKKPDAFSLGRSIDLKKPAYSLRILDQILKEGEKPERILGGLRYLWEKEIGSPQEVRRKLRLLLICDIDIKSGRLKPAFALEKLVIGLCGLRKLSC